MLRPRTLSVLLALAGLAGSLQAQSPSLGYSCGCPTGLAVTGDHPDGDTRSAVWRGDPAATCQERNGMYVGTALYFLQPYFESNTAFVTLTNIGTSSPSSTTTDFGGKFSLSPAVWVGWANEDGFGIRGRYFLFDQHPQASNTSLTSTQSATTAIAPPSSLAIPVVPGAASFFSPGILLSAGLGTDVLTFSSSLNISAADVEATYETGLGNWSLIYSGGGRYLHIAQNYTATLRNEVGTMTNETQRLTFDHNFNGGGPTTALEGRYRFRNTGLAIYGNARGSLLVGRTHQLQAFSQEVNDPTNLAGGNQLTTPSANTDRNTLLPVFETELGLEYGFAFRRVSVVLRGTVVDQTYFNAGSASQSTGNLSLFGAMASLLLTF